MDSKGTDKNEQPNIAQNSSKFNPTGAAKTNIREDETKYDEEIQESQMFSAQDKIYNGYKCRQQVEQYFTQVSEDLDSCLKIR